MSNIGAERKTGEYDAVVVGAGLAGLVAASELVKAGKRTVIVDQEPEASLGGQAWWSFGGLFFAGSPEQRRMGIRDSRDLALQDWMGSAGFDRPEDKWPRAWAEAYVDFASGEKYAWLRSLGIRIFPIVGWAERGGYGPTGHGNSVPRFHIVWGTGPAIVQAFLNIVREGQASGLVEFRFRHKVNEIVKEGGRVAGVRGQILADSAAERGQKSSRETVGDFSLRADAVILATGGIGGNHDLVRKMWPPRLGEAPKRLIQGVPDSVDGSMFPIAEAAGARNINSDRMWHYPEGIQNHSPVWTKHAIRILSGPSPLWIDARGEPLPVPLFPGFDSLGALRHITAAGADYSWFVLNQRIVKREFALSGSEQNPDLTGKNLGLLLKSRRNPVAPPPVAAFMNKGADFVIRDKLSDLVDGMNRLTEGDGRVEHADIKRLLDARDRSLVNDFGKDTQMTAIRGARAYLGDKLIRVTKPHRMQDEAAGPLIAVRLWVLTRKSLGGLETDLSSRVLDSGSPIPGLYAAGEIAGFGGGGVHGYRALEGTFLGGCIFSCRAAGKAAAKT